MLWGPDGAAKEALFCPPPEPAPASPGGKGLFLRSLTVVLEDKGVPWCEEAGDWEWPYGLDAPPCACCCEGDAVPEEESFLFFEDLFELLESCSCYAG